MESIGEREIKIVSEILENNQTPVTDKVEGYRLIKESSSEILSNQTEFDAKAP